MKRVTVNSINPKNTCKLIMLAILLVFFQVTVPALAQSSGGYDLSWSTIDGGGESNGGPYALKSTIGQPDAGVMAGGDYEVLGGFWPGEPLCRVDFCHFARFAEYWLETGTGLAGDLDGDEDVDPDDLSLFIDEWLCYCPLGWPL